MSIYMCSFRVRHDRGRKGGQDPKLGERDLWIGSDRIRLFRNTTEQ